MLLKRVGVLMSRPLPRSQPLWDIFVFEDIQGGSALLVRLHHSIADGIALMKVLLTLAGPINDKETPFPLERADAETVGAWQAMRRHAHQWLQMGHDLLFEPRRAADGLHQGWEASKALARVLSLSPDSDNALRGELSIRKVVSVSAPFALETMRGASKRLGCTINDFLMATLAGGLGRYLRRVQEVSSELEIRAVVPVDLRRGSLEELGNRFGLVFLALPVGDLDPASRLGKVHQSMLELKGSPEALVTFDLLSTVGALPTQLEQTIVEWFGNKATAVVTSLHGPDEPLYIGEARLTGLMYWVPQSGHLGVGVSMISYAGAMTVGVASDAGLLDDPQLLVQDFAAAYQEMLGLEAV
jgi:WS/DGAT/MGAT family acyltransferase